MSFRKASAGFILPTVVIASVVLFAVLTVAVSTMSGTANSLDSRVYQNMASEAAGSGLKYADSCIDANGIATITWSAGVALYPSVDCAGATSCSSPDCYLSNDGQTRITFKVTAEMSSSSAVVDITSNGIVELLRSDGSAWRSFSYSAKSNRALSAGGSLSGTYMVRALGVGSNHACAVDFGSKVYCWGRNDQGQLGDNTTTQRNTPVAVSPGAIPAGVNIESLSLGDSHTCVVGSDSKAYCWGLNVYGQLGDNTTTGRLVPVVVGVGAMPVGVSVRLISLGSVHTCAIGSDSKAYCWGHNSTGQIGDNTTTQRNTPVAVLPGAITAGVTLLSISAGDSSTCAVGSDGKAYCWGFNSSGQLGDNTTTQRNTPVAVTPGAMAAGVTVRSVSIKSSHACALGSDSRAYCWGGNGNGRLGDGTTTQRNAPVAVQPGDIPLGVTIQSVGVGASLSCAVGSDGKAYCWGANDNGQLGDGTTSQRTTPEAVLSGTMPNGVTVQSLGLGVFFSCATGSDSKAYCWGQNTYGQLGDDTVIQRNSPVTVLPGSITLSTGVFIKSISLGDGHTCAVGSDSKAYCWGQNNRGQLGDGTSTDRLTPVAVVQGAIPAGVTIQTVSAGTGSLASSHTCALGSDSKAYCWGYNTSGQLGDGTVTQRNSPVAITQGAIPSGVTIKSINSSFSYTCAVGSDDKAYCWGSNSSGSLGNGTQTTSLSPVSVLPGAMPPGVTIKSLALGKQNNACIIGSDGRAYCWGNNTYGQVGDNSTTSRFTPVAVAQGAMPPGVNFQSISIGGLHTCAVGSDSKAYCWGYNASGQLGDNSLSQRSTPVAVLAGAIPAGVTIKSLALSSMSTCALGSDSKAYCWGSNGGTLGDNTTIQRNTPVAVSQGVIPSGVTIQTLSAGSSNTCALGSDVRLYCWGGNDAGQIGDNNRTQRNSPVATMPGAIPSNIKIKSLYLSNTHSCLLDSNGRVFCWGNNGYGQLGDSTTSSRLVPNSIIAGAIPTGVTIMQVSLGDTHTCALGSNSKAYCWGRNNIGQLGIGTNVDSAVPVEVQSGAIPSGVTIVSLSTDRDHTCALGSDSKAYCWGSGVNGELGDNANVSRNLPIAVLPGAIPAGVSVRSLTVGYNRTCIIGSNGWAYCWGYNVDGAVGDGSTVQRSTPVAVLRGAIPAGVTINSLVTGRDHTCALGSDSRAYCWGYNGTGALGDTTFTSRSSPVLVQVGVIPSGTSVRLLFLNGRHTCAIGSNGKTYCWGYNSNGQLGDNTVTNRSTPIAVVAGVIPAGVTARSLAMGIINTCVIGSDSRAYCWGSNGAGQLGDNTTTQYGAPALGAQSPWLTISGNTADGNLNTIPRYY